MSRIRMKVFIRNESDATLMLTRAELEQGEFTEGWSPPTSIDPGERKGFQAEGSIVPIVDTPLTGTEGSVRFNIVVPDGGGELYLQWNSPLIESQYGNTFHIWGPPGWEVSHMGGQGHEGELEVRVRRTTRRTVPNFHPNGRGFIFKNNWSGNLPVISIGYLWNKLFDSLPGPLSDLGIGLFAADSLPLTQANQGMCGGMVYAVMDYYAHHLLPPSAESSPTSSDDILFTFIRDRLWDSFDVTGQGHRFLGYSSPSYPNGDEGVLQNILGLARGRSWVSYREEWPRIQADIDAGNLSPIALIQTDSLDIGNNHQVLAYGYEKSGQEVSLLIYDPNSGQNEVKYQFNVTATDGEVNINRTPPNEKRIWCFFRINGYGPKIPPNGRRIKSVREAFRATTGQNPPYSIRGPVSAGSASGSLTNWMRNL